MWGRLQKLTKLNRFQSYSEQVYCPVIRPLQAVSRDTSTLTHSQMIQQTSAKMLRPPWDTGSCRLPLVSLMSAINALSLPSVQLYLYSTCCKKPTSNSGGKPPLTGRNLEEVHMGETPTDGQVGKGGGQRKRYICAHIYAHAETYTHTQSTRRHQ